MDNKITRRRLSDFLSYEWIIMIIAIVFAIMGLEFIYTVSATRASVGQQFKFYFDENLSSNVSDFGNVLEFKVGENGKTFSYDVMEVSSEALTSSFNVLSARLSVQDGDVIFSDTMIKDEETGESRAKSLVDGFSICSLEKLLTDAKSYLSDFTENGELNDELIIAHFNERMKRDNRFRTEKAKETGRALEIERIKKLSEEVQDFQKIMSLDVDGLFFNYTRYEYSSQNEKDDVYKTLYEREISSGKENLRYGINLAALSYETEGKQDVSRFFQNRETNNAENVVLMVFDFLSYQPDLQFETISFINTIFRTCSDFLD